MKQIPLAAIKEIYRTAINADVSNEESVVWWEEVAIEIRHVIAAPTDAAAANIIVWWHADWSMISDTPLAAAARLRDAARSHA